MARSSSSDSPDRKHKRKHEKGKYRKRSRSRERTSAYDKRERREKSDKNGRSRSPRRRDHSENRSDVHIKKEPLDFFGKEKPRSEREWDKGKLKYEPYGGDGSNKGMADFKPSGILKGGPGPSDSKDVEKPSFVPSGNLNKDTNTYKGVVIKYNEPPEAKMPKLRWRMYPFKGEDDLPVIYVHRQSAYLIGKDRKISDFPVDHPSCSRQHAVLQYRSLKFERSDGSTGRRTRPYIIDLGSANGTFLNGNKIEPQRYYELKERDILRFGFSSREYVMLNENSVENKIAEDESDEETGGVEIDEAAEKRIKMTDEDDAF